MAGRQYAEALILYDRGCFEKAQELCELALDSQRSTSSTPDHALFGNTLLLLANSHQSRGSFTEAQRLYGTCAKYVSDNLGAAYPGLASCLMNHGILHMSHRSWKEALSLLGRAFEVVQNVIGPERLILADIHHNLGCCFQATGDLPQALTHFMMSLRIREKFRDPSGEVELKLALTMECIALIFRQQGNMVEGLKLLKDIAKVRRQRLGPYDLEYATALFECGVLAWELQKFRVARADFSKCLEIRTRALGSDHPDTVSCLNFLRTGGSTQVMHRDPRVGGSTAKP